jgi:tellurite methyltransferase
MYDAGRPSFCPRILAENYAKGANQASGMLVAQMRRQDVREDRIVKHNRQNAPATKGMAYSQVAEGKPGGIVTMTVQEQFGQIDIYVFDQILRGNIAPGMRVLDAGCGYGRNLVHLLRERCDVFGLDADPDGVRHVRRLSESLQTGLPTENFRVGSIESMPFPDAFADVVICNSVLHFARDEEHFRSMLQELWRVVKPGGMLFSRLGSRIGMDFPRLRENIFAIGDGSEWFLVDQGMLLDLTEEMNAVLVDPLKTTIVQDYRCMTTWVLRKRRPK